MERDKSEMFVDWVCGKGKWPFEFIKEPPREEPLPEENDTLQGHVQDPAEKSNVW